MIRPRNIIETGSEHVHIDSGKVSDFIWSLNKKCVINSKAKLPQLRALLFFFFQGLDVINGTYFSTLFKIWNLCKTFSCTGLTTPHWEHFPCVAWTDSALCWPPFLCALLVGCWSIRASVSRSSTPSRVDVKGTLCFYASRTWWCWYVGGALRNVI